MAKNNVILSVLAKVAGESGMTREELDALLDDVFQSAEETPVETPAPQKPARVRKVNTKKVTSRSSATRMAKALAEAGNTETPAPKKSRKATKKAPVQKEADPRILTARPAMNRVCAVEASSSDTLLRIVWRDRMPNATNKARRTFTEIFEDEDEYNAVLAKIQAYQHFNTTGERTLKNNKGEEYTIQKFWNPAL